MERYEVFDKIRSCISPVLHCDLNDISEDFGFLVTFGWDSLVQVEIFCAVEEAFELSLPDHLVEELITVRDYVDYIYQLNIKEKN